jgi:hypothetical protein
VHGWTEGTEVNPNLYNKPPQCTAFSLHSVTTPLHVSSPFVAHNQEAECVMWKMVLGLFLSRL